MGYHEGLTHIQLWLVHSLVSQTVFDIWDVILSEMEDTLAEGFHTVLQEDFYNAYLNSGVAFRS